MAQVGPDRLVLVARHLLGASSCEPLVLAPSARTCHCQESQQQQQRQDGAVSPESQSAALSFGGLSYEECRSVFLSPNVRSSTNPHLPSLWIPPSASQTAVLTAAAANAPFSMSSFYPVTSPSKVAAVSNATDVPNAGALPSNAMVANTAAYPSLAALNLPMKRAREELSALTTDPPLLVNASRDELGLPRRVAQRPQSLRELLQLRGERCRQQQALWPGVGSERAGFGHLLLEERRQQQGERSAAQRVLWPRIGSESALPDDVLLGFSSDEPAFIQRSALSAPPPTQPCSVLPSPIPPQLAALPASAPCIGDFDPCCGELASCFGDAPSAGARAAAQHLVQSVDSCNGHSDLHDNKPDMPVHDTSNHDIPVNDNSNVPHGRSESLFLDAPISHLCLAEPTTTMPRAGESLAGQSHPTQGHQQQHLSGHQHCVQLTCVPSLSAHQPQPPPLSQPLAQPLMRPLSQVPLLSVFGNDSPQHSHDTLSHQKAPHMPAPVPPPALPHAQPHVIVSPPPTPMKPAVAPCFNVGDALGVALCEAKLADARRGVCGHPITRRNGGGADGVFFSKRGRRGVATRNTLESGSADSSPPELETARDTPLVRAGGGGTRELPSPPPPPPLQSESILFIGKVCLSRSSPPALLPPSAPAHALPSHLLTASPLIFPDFATPVSLSSFRSFCLSPPLPVSPPAPFPSTSLPADMPAGRSTAARRRGCARRSCCACWGVKLAEVGAAEARGARIDCIS
ncbi:unnamed protein product [Closterium sp. NIES-53]